MKKKLKIDIIHVACGTTGSNSEVPIEFNQFLLPLSD